MTGGVRRAPLVAPKRSEGGGANRSRSANSLEFKRAAAGPSTQPRSAIYEMSSNLHPLDDGRMLVAAEYLDLLRSNGLMAFGAVMQLESGKMMRSVPGRSTVRIELHRPRGGVAGETCRLAR